MVTQHTKRKYFKRKFTRHPYTQDLQLHVSPQTPKFSKLSRRNLHSRPIKRHNHVRTIHSLPDGLSSVLRSALRSQLRLPNSEVFHTCSPPPFLSVPKSGIWSCVIQAAIMSLVHRISPVCTRVFGPDTFTVPVFKSYLKNHSLFPILK